jgi:Kef-type K+ transport system membrane component KefB
MDVLVVVVFAGVVSVGQAAVSLGGPMELRFIGVVLLELAGSILGGIALGWVISLYIRYVEAHLEPMLICLTAGFWVQNFSRGGAPLMEKIDRSSLPIYVIFFSLTGAALNIGALRQTWLVALLLVAVRSALIWLGAFLGASLSGDPSRFRQLSGLSFITQAGVSLGLAGIVMRRFPEWGAALATVIVAVIAINQIIGPVAFKLALGAVGEARAIPGRRSEPPGG